MLQTHLVDQTTWIRSDGCVHFVGHVIKTAAAELLNKIISWIKKKLINKNELNSKVVNFSLNRLQHHELISTMFGK